VTALHKFDMASSAARKKVIVLSGLGLLLIVLAVLIRLSPESAGESAVMTWIRSMYAPGLDRLMESVSRFTNQPGLMLGPVTALVFLLRGRIRHAVIFSSVALVVAVTVYVLDFSLGEIAGRGRPLPYETRPSYPSGHTSGSTWFFVFLMFLVIRSGATDLGKGLVTGGLGTLVLLVGLSRIFLHRHWPLDVIGGYALGVLAAICAIWLFDRLMAERSLSGWLFWINRDREPKSEYVTAGNKSFIGSA
jgi:membrane-associated phospholipid phosphatase